MGRAICIVEGCEVCRERGLVRRLTSDVTSGYSKFGMTFASCWRILLLMLIWVQFLAPHLVSIPNLDRCVRWCRKERRICVDHGSQIQVRPFSIENRLCFGLGGQRGAKEGLQT